MPASKKVQATTAQRKKRMLECLEKKMGVVSDAAKAAKIDRSLHYRWMKRDSRYKEKVEELNEFCIDTAESAMWKLIKSGNVKLIEFYLKTRGKLRGYTENVEEKELPPIEITFREVAPRSEEDIDRLMKMAEED